mmetsp:Transcript_64833/g.76113  ORF Transcript_64833/g.76113 Transcript_64833/m.76113 type:complete len:402 (-) Transcript_64833:461-1666(-)
MSSHSKSSSSKNDDAPLPAGWTKNYSNSQKRYFWCHAGTKTSQWHAPTAEEANDPTRAKQTADMKAKQEREDDEKTRKRSHSGGSNSAKNDHKSHKTGLGISVNSISNKSSKHTAGASASSAKKRQSGTNAGNIDLSESSNVAIIVPFRDLHPEQNRSKHLAKFLPHMTSFLSKLVKAGKCQDFHIYIIDQSDDGRKFNRGKLLNIGFDIAKKSKMHKHDVFIFHDVDLLPGDDLGNWYTRFPRNPIHIARCWGRYSNNPKYFGGIVSFSASDMKRINGYPNTFWGWGGEDDEMQKRCEKLRIAWESPPQGTITDLENMSLHEKLAFLRTKKKWKCMVKWEALDEHEKTWRTNGLTDLTYNVISRDVLDETNGCGSKISVDVQLNPGHWANDKCSVDYLGS